VALTKSGKDLIVPIFRKHSAEIGRVLTDANPKSCKSSKAFSRRLASALGRLLKREARSSIHDRSVQNIGRSVIGLVGLPTGWLLSVGASQVRTTF